MLKNKLTQSDLGPKLEYLMTTAYDFMETRNAFQKMIAMVNDPTGVKLATQQEQRLRRELASFHRRFELFGIAPFQARRIMSIGEQLAAAKAAVQDRLGNFDVHADDTDIDELLQNISQGNASDAAVHYFINLVIQRKELGQLEEFCDMVRMLHTVGRNARKVREEAIEALNAARGN